MLFSCIISIAMLLLVYETVSVKNFHDFIKMSFFDKILMVEIENLGYDGGGDGCLYGGGGDRGLWVDCVEFHAIVY